MTRSCACDRESSSTKSLPPDQEARDRIRCDLDSNLLVEAGAGSGKTTALVSRMAELILRGKGTVDQIAAVTFTRKAAAELREGFQDKLEKVVASAETGSRERQAANDALRDLDKAFLGTIHAFCARLLRQRPLDAGLDPEFREVMESDAERLQDRAWGEFLERLAVDADPRLERLERLGISPHRLKDVYCRMVENPDVDFGCESPSGDQAGTSCSGLGASETALAAWFEGGAAKAELPEKVADVRGELQELLDEAAVLMPATEPEKGWDGLAGKVRALLFSQRLHDWDKPSDFFEALATLYRRRPSVTQNRWSDTSQGKAAAKALGEQFSAFCRADARAANLLEAWWAHRYPVAMSVAAAAARHFARWRKQEGVLTFADLLVLAAEMLREHSQARRELGNRYRYVLVDEFQDTDPLQAEILFLLCSEPGPSSELGPLSDPGAPDPRGDPAKKSAWMHANPRPGALFVVGDPKQSIYRFRRADISLYQSVKKRFQSFGEVLLLTANFRSRDKMGVLIDGVFNQEARFPSEDNDRQAAFEPLVPQRKCKTAVLKSYAVDSAKQADMATDDAAKIAAEISRQVDAGEREPGDFMVLLRARKHLTTYADALEDRNLPVDVSGAGVGFQDQMAAFLLLFKCLADPSHAVLVLGVLTGRFFGVTLDQIVRFRDAGGQLAVNRPPRLHRTHGDAEDGNGAEDFAEMGCEKAAEALRTLHGWWKLARREPADVTAERLVRETGVFPLVAGEALGQLRAGSVAYLLDAVRASALAGDASLAGAVRAMEAAVAWREAEPSLAPARKDAVRVMNVHRAKGLEAKVVFLAAPFGEGTHTPKMRVVRGEDGVARGTIPIVEPRRGSFGPPTVIAQPLAWEADCEEEVAFDEAEKVRLVYVAATRACDELWVAKRGRVSAPGSRRAGKRKKNDSPWAAIEEWLDGEGRAVPRESGGNGEGPIVESVDLSRGESGSPDQLDEATDLSARLDQTDKRRAEAGEPSYQVESVSVAVKDDVPAMPASVSTAAVRSTSFAPPALGPWPGGAGWGEVAHAALAAAESGAGRQALASVARRTMREKRLPVDAEGRADGLPVLMSLVEAVQASPVWRRAMDSAERYAEMPFALVEAAGKGGLGGDDAVPPVVVEGVIDLVFKDRETGAWVVVDYKTDKGGDLASDQRVPQYRAQVDRYAECWEAVVGERVGERILLFATQGRAESW